MSTYKALVGKKIKSVSSDPSDSADGQMWYNTTTQSLRGLAIFEAWSATSNTNTAKQRSGGCGTQTAGLNCGGFAAPPGTEANNGTEEYNGSGWSNAPNLNTARGNTKLVGIQTAGVFFGQGGGGQTQSGVTEEYNGTAWTTVNPMANAINYRSGCGIETALLASGGNVPGTNRSNLNEEYDGTNWTTGGALPQKQSSNGQAGTQTAAINSFGYTNNPVPGNSGDALNAISLEYDGSSWTAGPNGNGVVELTGYAMGSGTQTDAIFAGAPSTNSCKYDGTNFSVGPALAVAQDSASHGSTSASATWIAKGSPVPSVGDRVQEFNRSTNSITAAAFASGTNLPVARGQGGGCGTQTAALQCGGIADSPTSNTNTSFEYDGSAWAASPGSLNASTRNNSNFGIQTAAVTVGSLGPVTAAVDVYNGSSWTSGTSYPAPVSNIGVAGTTTAGVGWGGDQDPGFLTTTNEYNGSWTAGNTLPAGRSNSACAGTQTAAVTVGGYVGPNSPSATVVSTTLEYDGTNWSSSNNDLVARYNAGAAGIQTSALIFGGNTPSNTAQATLYDGTSFATQPSMGTARFLQTQGLGTTSTVALAAAGQTTTRVATVEEFTGETETANVETFTTS